MVVSLITTAVIAVIVFFVSNDFGITWDEPIHFGNANAIMEWVLSPSMKTIDKTFRVTDYDVHPPLRKLAAGATHELFTNRLKILDNTRGYRVSSLLFVIPFVFVYTYVAIGQFGLFFGMLVPFFYSLMPHVLFLTPLVTMDYAVAALWFVAVVAIMKGVKHWGWLMLCGLLVGLVLLTKLHGFLLFVPVGGYWIVHHKKTLFQARIAQLSWLTWGKLGIVLGVSFIVYFVGWPWLWTSPISKLQEYFAMQIAHKGIPVLLLGRTYEQAPWWYVWIMVAATTPTFIFVLFLIGCASVIARGREWDRVVLCNALYPLILFSLPGVYRYDGVRLFLASFPFICLLAGKGVMALLRSVRSRYRPVISGLLVIGFVGTVYASVLRIHPWESSYYNELVGSIEGAFGMGFETEYWGNAFQAVLPWMNEHKKSNMCVFPTTHPFYYYQAMGALDPDVVFTADEASCVYSVILMRQGLFGRNPGMTAVVAMENPVYSVRVDGVNLVGVYKRKKIIQ